MRTLRLTLTIGAPLVLLLPSALPGTEAYPVGIPNVGVVVHNLSGLPADIVEEAEAACQQIYRAAGILVTWLNDTKISHGLART